MKVTIERIQSAIAPRRAGAAKSIPPQAAFAGLVDNDLGASQSREATAAGAASAIDSLLAAQEVPDSTMGRGRALAHGRDLLDQLDSLRLALISGHLPRARLQRLVASLTAKRAAVADPALGAVLDEIELRARVELAKYDTRQ